MGERGAIASGDGSGHRTAAELEAREVYLRPVTVDRPSAPEAWAPATAAAWETYWSSYIAQAVEEVDVPSLVRLFGLVDRMERMWAIVDDETEGSYTVTTAKSGDKAHPLIASIATLDGMVDRLERQFGIRPLSRARLGLKGAAAASAQAKMGAAGRRRERV